MFTTLLFLFVFETMPVVSQQIREPAPEMPVLVADGRPALPSPADSIRLAVKGLSPDKSPVLRNRRPLAFLRDLNADEAGDIILLAVRTEDPEKTSFEYLSDFSRMFDPSAEGIEFSVEIFRRTERGVVYVKSVEAGKRVVCESFEELPFPDAARLPWGISLVFPSADGREHLWIIFPSPERHTRFSFREKADVKAVVRDIDGNGFIDLLLFEDVFEDSAGYETYITWFRWDGSNFRKHRSTNIVRNLRGFFAANRDLLLARNWGRFLDHSLSAEHVPLARRTDVAKTLERLFKLSPPGAPADEEPRPYSFTPEILGSTITDAVFPEVLENPFPLGRDGPESFPFTIRITSDGENYFFTARIAMNMNPFGGKMFYFVLE